MRHLFQGKVSLFKMPAISGMEILNPERAGIDCDYSIFQMPLSQSFLFEKYGSPCETDQPIHLRHVSPAEGFI